jgi:hypothetical protein
MWKSPQLEMFEEGEADTARHLKLNLAEEIRYNVLFLSARYVQGVHRYNDALSILEIWFFDESRTTPGYTSLTRDGKDLSSSTRL